MYVHLNEAKKISNTYKTSHKLNKIRKILNKGLEPRIEIYADKLSREEACQLEIELIEKFGRADLGLGPLTNMTKGGDGIAEWSPELRNVISKKRKGMISAKDIETGEYIQVKDNDPRWMSGKLVGINSGLKGITNSSGILDGYIISKSLISGEVLRVRKDDPRWVSGELVGINYGKDCHENTKIAASKRWKGVPKSEDHNKKNSDSIKLLKWYCNFDTNKVGRFKEHEQPLGYVRVSGPHKREPL